MRIVVVYESMFGNTHSVAAAIADGLRDTGEVVVSAVGEVTPEQAAAADLLVVGGPTHAHGMSSSQSRKGAPDYVERSNGDLTLEPDATGDGLRDWFNAMGKSAGRSDAFDTRADAPVLLTGHACKGIADRLHKHGRTLVTEPMSFIVDKHNHLLPGELDRATAWGADIAARVVQPR